ncbi:MAG: 50S ribosomal protein L25 [Pseudobdellovibrionaceae bacterium]
MSKRHDLTVEPRQTGKHFSRTYRAQKKIPAVIYGSLEKNQNVILEENTVLKFNTRAYENALFTLKSADSKLNGVVVLMKDVVVHPLSRRPEHVDLFALDLKKPVRISVEVRVEGKPIGIADGGLLNVVTRQIEIECLPTDIPEGFTVDVSGLGVGDALHVSDVKVPSTVKVLSSSDLTIAVVNLFVEEAAAPTVEAAAPAAGAAAPAAGAAAPAAGAAAAPAAGAKKDAPKK